MLQVLAVVLIAMTADPATEAARRYSDEAKTAYALGRFDEARASYERAYQARPLPAFLFNIGQCHFQEGRYEQAIFLYERYLELAPRADNRAIVVELIADARKRAKPPPPARASVVDEEQEHWVWFGAGVVTAAAGGALLLWMWNGATGS